MGSFALVLFISCQKKYFATDCSWSCFKFSLQVTSSHPHLSLPGVKLFLNNSRRPKFLFPFAVSPKAFCSVHLKGAVSTLQGQTIIFIFSTILSHISARYLQPNVQAGRMGSSAKAVVLGSGQEEQGHSSVSDHAPPLSLKIISLHGSTPIKQWTHCHLTGILPGNLERGYKHVTEVATCCSKHTAKQLVVDGQHHILYLISSLFYYNLW